MATRGTPRTSPPLSASRREAHRLELSPTSTSTAEILSLSAASTSFSSTSRNAKRPFTRGAHDSFVERDGMSEDAELHITGEAKAAAKDYSESAICA